MQFKMNTIENSYDFLFNSLDFYRIADEHGTHDPDISDINNKKKWKMAFIFLVQATELLIKDILASIHPLLVFENIDIPIQQNEKTVSFAKAIGRLRNSSEETISEEECNFLRLCSKIRNEYIHSEVTVSTPELKPKYCTLFQIYTHLHDQQKEPLRNLLSKDYLVLSIEIKLFNERYEIFRGSEYLKERVADLKEEIEINRKLGFFKTESGELIPRIRYGQEKDYYETHSVEDYPITRQNTFCGDCAAKLGEYHLDACDWEMCPVCLQAVFACDCDLVLTDEKGNEFDSPYMMK